MRQYVIWAIVLLLQNASFTFVSRARNSASYTLHATAAMCSNSIYFIQMFISLDVLMRIIREGTWLQRVGVVIFYTTFTVIGSVGMHYIGKNYIETKKERQVGAR